MPKVLIVEDEILLRMRAVDIMEDAGFSPIQAVNADKARSILESRCDISRLFTDIEMPGSIDSLKLAHAVYDRWCVYRKLKLGRSGDEVRQGWRVN